MGKSRKSLTGAGGRLSGICAGRGPNNNKPQGLAGPPGAGAWGRNPDWGRRVGRFPRPQGIGGERCEAVELEWWGAELTGRLRGERVDWVARRRRAGANGGLAAATEGAWLERAGGREREGSVAGLPATSRSGGRARRRVEERGAGGSLPSSVAVVLRASSARFLPSPPLHPRPGVSGGERREGTFEEAKAE